MKANLIFAALAASAVAGPAFAADLPSRKTSVVPPPAMLANWSGFYVGLNAGAVFGGASAVETSGVDLSGLAAVGTATLAQMTGTIPGENRAGFLGGGQVGWNWQSGALVAGVEADLQGVLGRSSAQARTQVATVIFLLTTSVATAHRLDYLGTVRGRLGFEVAPGWLLYATGGLAYGGVSASTAILQSNAVGFGFGASHVNGARAGWTLGGGVEWAFARNWSAKLEYLYYDLGRVTYSQTMLASLGVPVYAVMQTSLKQNGHVVRAGVNYRFNWGAATPVVAKY